MKKILIYCFSIFLILHHPYLQAQEKESGKVLLFSKTAAFRHESIPKGVEVLSKLLKANHIAVQHTEDANIFTTENLKQFKTVIFLNTTGDILNAEQKSVFESYIRNGGGFVGIHAASDTEYSWPWYGGLVGGYFESHPAVQQARIDVLNQKHPSTKHLKKVWLHKDEFYDFKDLKKDQLSLLMMLDESSYQGGKMGKFHPIAWFQEYDGGRSFYTGLGHTNESYDSEEFQKHMLGGIKWAMKLKK